MEGIILLGLLGTGYFLNENKQKTSSISPPLHMDSGNSIYDTTNFKDSKLYEKNLVEKYNQLSKKQDSNIINSNNLQGRSVIKENIAPKFKSLSGEFLDDDQFKQIEEKLR